MRTRIVDILNYKARRTVAKRELGMTDLGDEFIIDEEFEEAAKSDLVSSPPSPPNVEHFQKSVVSQTVNDDGNVENETR